MNDLFEKMKYLTSIPAVSGHEDKIIYKMHQKLDDLADETYIDKVGNLTATFNKFPSKDEPSILVFAHVDEVGMIVRQIDEDGFLKIERIGGVHEKSLIGQYVDVHSLYDDNFVTGVFGSTSHHVTLPEDKHKVPQRSELYIDIGLDSKQEVLDKGIDVGSIITYHHNFLRNGNNKITSKSIDNRVGIYLLLKLAEHLYSSPPNGTVYIVMSVQEEFNVRGVLPAFEKTKPDASICLDITPACDTPDLKMLYDISLGGGPAITHMNTYGKGPIGGLVPNPKLRKYIEDNARQLKIKYQNEVISGLITDDAFATLSGQEGVAMAHLSVPLRYTHSSFETVNIHDIINTSSLLNQSVKNFDKNLDLRRGVF